MRDLELSIVVPAYNEAGRINATIDAIRRYAITASSVVEIIVVDDGSTDATRDIVRAQAGGTPPLVLLEASANQGKGGAVRRGVLASRAGFVLTTDADLATPVTELPKLVDAVRRGVDIAIGSRAVPGAAIEVHQPAYRELMGKAFNRLVQTLVLPGIWDTQCGFKLFRGSVARRLFACCVIDGFAFDVEVLGLAARAGYVIVEVPVRWAHVAHSRVRLGRDSVTMLVDLMRIAARLRSLDYRPLAARMEEAPREF